MKLNRNDVPGLADGLESLLDGGFDPETLDPDTRRRLSEAARKLSLATEAPVDTVHRIGHVPLQLPLALIGLETGIFDTLVNLKGAVATHAELAAKTSLDPALLKRFLRYYQSFGIISQPGDDEFAANNITQALVSPGGRSAVGHFHTNIIPVFSYMPQFLRENKNAKLADATDIPWYPAHRTTDPPFKWIHDRPESLKYFMGWMAGQRDGQPSFLSVVDFEEEFAKRAAESTPVFVDIGGSVGHQCIALRQKYPNLVGRIVLQDLPGTIERAKANPVLGLEGIEALAHDFFTPQPLQGARAYYLRNVLHDWPDDRCIEILQNIKPAMAEKSRVLIDEMILPEKGAPWKATQRDMVMGAINAARERSHSEWLALFDRAGFKVDRMWKYTEDLSDHLISLGLK